MTKCYAIADGVIRRFTPSRDYGTVVGLEFEHRGRTLYAFYAHLSIVSVRDAQPVRRGEVIALTGRSGNAGNLSGDDHHLHFEIRTVLMNPGHGLMGRIDPAQVYGATPLHGPLAGRTGDRTAGGFGLKIKSTGS